MFLNILFATSAFLTLASAFGVLFTRNIMHSCVFLLGTLIGVAGLYVTLGADFVAATQTMVYVGGVVILMLFAVMLTGGTEFVSKAQRLLGLIPTMGNVWSYSIGVSTALVLVLTSYGIISNAVAKWDVATYGEFEPTVDKIGHLLVTDHVLAFEISSVLLLGALVGAAIIARPQKG